MMTFLQHLPSFDVLRKFCFMSFLFEFLGNVSLTRFFFLLLADMCFRSTLNSVNDFKEREKQNKNGPGSAGNGLFAVHKQHRERGTIRRKNFMLSRIEKFNTSFISKSFTSLNDDETRGFSILISHILILFGGDEKSISSF